MIIIVRKIMEIKNSPNDVAATTYVTQTALHKAYSHT